MWVWTQVTFLMTNGGALQGFCATSIAITSQGILGSGEWVQIQKLLVLTKAMGLQEMPMEALSTTLPNGKPPLEKTLKNQTGDPACRSIFGFLCKGKAAILLASLPLRCSQQHRINRFIFGHHEISANWREAQTCRFRRHDQRS